MAEPNGRPPEVQAAVALAQVEAVREGLERIERQLGNIEERIEKRFDNLDERLRRLEEWRSWVLGAAAAVGAAAGWLSRVVTDKLIGR